MNKNILTKLCLYILAVVLVISACQPTNNFPSTSIKTDANFNKIQRNTFKVKNSAPVLYLPFSSGANRSGSTGGGSASVTHNDGVNYKIGGLASISIGSDGNIGATVASPNGDFYDSDYVSFVATTGSSNIFQGSATAPLDLYAGKPCDRGPGNVRGSFVSGTGRTPYPLGIGYRLKSGTITLSLSGRDLIADVSDISSTDDTFGYIYESGTCINAKHTTSIQSGTAHIIIKDVAFEPLDLDVSPTNASSGLGVSKELISLNPDNDGDNTATINVTAASYETWTLTIGGKFIDSGTGNKTITIDKDHTYGLSDGDYTKNVILSCPGLPPVIKSLKIDSTNPVIGSIEIDDQSEPAKIIVKVSDPVVNGFSSKLDPSETKIESSLGGMSSFDGVDTLTYTLPSNSKINELGSIKIHLKDKAKNKDDSNVGNVTAEPVVNESNESFSTEKFSIKGIGEGINNDLHTVYLDPTKPQCHKNYNMSSYIGFFPTPKQGSVLKKATVTYIITRIGKNNKLVYRKFFNILPPFNPPTVNFLNRPASQDFVHKISFDGIATENGSSDNVNQNAKQPLTGGLYKLEVKVNYAEFTGGEKYIFIKKASNAITAVGELISFFQTNTEYAYNNEYYFRVVNGPTGNGYYSYLDTPGVDSKRDKSNAFDPDDKPAIFKSNQERNKSKIDSFVTNYNNGKLPYLQITDSAKQRLVVDDVTGQILTIGAKGSIFGYNNPDDLPIPLTPDGSNPLKFSNIDHIIPKSPKSDSCCPKGNRRFANAQVIDALTNQNPNKSDKCGFTKTVKTGPFGAFTQTYVY